MYTVTMSAASASPVTVEYGTRQIVAGEYTATAGVDYVPDGGTLTFLPGEWEKSFSIPTVEDALVERDEGFEVYIANASGAAIGGGGASNPASGTILNDDVAPPPLPTLVVSDTSIVEGAEAIFLVSLSTAATAPVSVNYMTADGTATIWSGAVWSGDYTATFGTLTFPAGVTQLAACRYRPHWGGHGN